MKKLAFVILLTVVASLGGCADVQKLGRAFTFAAGTTVPPQAIIAAANVFDGLEGTATQYLRYCKGRLAEPACSATKRRSVIRYVRSGRAARNKLETYITTNTSAPSAIYNVLIASITSLQASAANVAGAVK